MQIRLPERTAKSPLAKVAVSRGGNTPSMELFDDSFEIYTVKGDFDSVTVYLADGRGVIDETFTPIVVKGEPAKPVKAPKWEPKAPKSEPKEEPKVEAKEEPKVESYQGWGSK